MKSQIVLVLSTNADFFTWCETLLSDFELLPASSLEKEPFAAVAVLVDYACYDRVILSSIYTYFQEKNQVRCIFLGDDFKISAGERKNCFTKAKFFTPEQYMQVLKAVQIEWLIKKNLTLKLDHAEFASKSRDSKFVEAESFTIGTQKQNPNYKEEMSRLMFVAAESDANVLLLGETGVGKSSAAKKIHEMSSRREKKFIEVNIPNHIGRLESDLFGTVRGAFTEAQNTEGLLKAADGGTVFFDEIGELPLEDQSRMLSLIETRSFRKMGSGTLEKFNARMIFATNQDLKSLVRQHRFREDLFYRINTIVIEVPPLKNHSEDIPLIAKDFAAGWNKMISESALMKLRSYSWPGNIRELKNCMERSCLICRNPILEEHDILLDAFSGSFSYC